MDVPRLTLQGLALSVHLVALGFALTQKVQISRSIHRGTLSRPQRAKAVGTSLDETAITRADGGVLLKWDGEGLT